MTTHLTEDGINDILRAFEESHFSRLDLSVGPVRIAADRAAAVVASPPAPHTTDVTTPLLGIFQAGHEPGAPPLVAHGTAVRSDTTIGMIRVLETVTAVEAGLSGIVAEVLVQDGQLVEFGQALLRIGAEPSVAADDDARSSRTSSP